MSVDFSLSRIYSAAPIQNRVCYAILQSKTNDQEAFSFILSFPAFKVNALVYFLLD